MADPDSRLFVQLYSKLAATFSVAQTVGKPSGSILSLMVPGLYVPPGMDAKDPQVQYDISNVLNPVLLCDWAVVPGVGVISDVYRNILDGKEPPLVHLTPGQRAELDAARAYLFLSDDEPTPAYAEYQSYQLDYLTALDAYEQAEATEANGGLPMPPKVVKQLEHATKAWAKKGHRSDVDLAIATIANYEAMEPATFWYRLAERFRAWTREAGTFSEYLYTTSIPPYEFWFQDFGWSDFLFDDRDFDTQERSGGVGVGGNCGESCCCGGVRSLRGRGGRPVGGFWSSLGGDFRGDEEPVGAKPTKFHLTCQLRRVEIVRPWMDTNVFSSRAWRWSPASVSFGVVVSTGGDLVGSVVPTGVMPVLPTTAILARDVEIVWDDSGRTAAEVAQRIGSGHEIRFGPFRLSRATVGTGGHISMPDPQFIGYLSSLVPRCPNPDPALPWPTTQRSRSLWFGRSGDPARTT